jgi:hypothetical protein
VRMRIEAPMRVSARGGGDDDAGQYENDRFCCKRIALQKLGVTAWEEDKQ